MKNIKALIFTLLFISINLLSINKILAQCTKDYNVGGGGSYCAGGAGVTITLSGSKSGTTYTLYNNGAVVSTLAGTGSGLTWANQTLAGTYTVIATASGNCTRTMPGSATVTVNALPTQFSVSGGGAFCSASAGVTVSLSGSQTGVNYQLKINGTNSGSAITGTGAALNWSNQTTAGTYTVAATNATTGCTQSMTGSATVSVNPLPVQYTVSGGGTICSGTTGVTVTLNGSDAGVNYQLLINGINSGSPLAGTGGALNWASQNSQGNYTVVATNAATSCTQSMTGSATVTVNPLPTQYSITGGGAICSGAAGVTITLSGSQTGVNYQLKINGTNSGAAIAGTGAAISWNSQTTAGTYTAVATNATTGCAQSMTGSATLTVNPLPTQYSVTGGGTICSGATGVTVTLSGSQAGVNYQLLINGANSGSSIAGTGSSLNWSNQTTAGSYTVTATDATTNCVQTMTGSATVTVNSLPTLYSVNGGGALCSGASGLTVTLSGSQTGVNYQLMINGVNQGSPVAGTGSTLSWTNQTTAGNYTVAATNATTSCTQTMAGGAAVTVNPLPTQYTVSGGGTICSGAAGVTITLSSSQTGVNYQLKISGTNSGAAIPGTGSSLNWANQTSTGAYTVVAANATTSCTQTMTGSATVTVNPLPTQYTVSGGGAICSGAAGVSVTLSSSETGVNYQLKINGTNSGAAIAGTGAALNWANQTTAGTYTVVATNATTSCTQTMTGSAPVTVNALPTQFTVSGGGTICSGATGATVTLSNSQTGVNYQLLINGTNSGAALVGTGAALNWANQTTAGTYTVVATNATTSCTQTMTGNATVSVNALPVQYTVSGGGAICSGASGVTIALSGSQTGVNYQLKINGTNSGSVLAGTASSLSWSNQTTAGTYTVVATNATTSCSQTMTGSATVIVNALPTQFAVGGGGAICSGAAGVAVTLSNSEAGVNYQLKINGTNSGSPIAGTGTSLSWSNQTTAGTYTVVATNATTSCTQTMTGSATVTVNVLPTQYTVGGGGTICSGAAGVAVTLSSSETGVNYQLKINGTNSGSVIPGTGTALNWSNQTTAGTYTVAATNSTTGCTQTMTGSATVTVNVLPTQYTVSGGGAFCSGAVGVTVTLSSSQTGVNYQLKINGTNSGTAIAGTGVAISWNSQTAAGTYTVAGTNTSTSCTQTMTGSASVIVNPLPTQYTMSGGGAICTGAAGATVTLSSSQPGVNYQLKTNGTNSGSSVAGTGNALNWTNQTTAGSYTIAATNATTSCSQTMIGSATVTVNPSPTQYTVSGGGTICAGGTGVNINLSGSTTNVNYQLMINGVNSGSPIAGTGSALNWTIQTTAGTYTVVATVALTGCSQTMTGSAAVTVNPLPTLFTVQGSGAYCTGDGITISLAGSQTNVSYQLNLNGTSYGSAVAGTGSALTWPDIRTAGTYTVLATFNTSSCSQMMNGNAVITVNPTCITLNNWAFQYRYDGRNRMVAKKVPGAEWVYMVYDNRDRLVMTQDGNQRLSNQWTVTKYDSLNRPVITALYVHGSKVDQATMSGLISNSRFCEYYSSTFTSNHGYSSRVFPISNLTILTVAYYDNYNFVSDFFGNAYNYLNSEIPIDNVNNIPAQEAANNAPVVGHPTGGKVNVLGITTSFLKSVNYYDAKYRTIQTVADNNKGGTDRTTSVVDFLGRVLKTKTTHKTPTHSDQTIARRVVYDHVGRMKQVFHNVNANGEKLLLQNEYNEIGQLVDKKLYSTDNGISFKQSVDYRYNIRGWLQSMNNSQLTNDGVTNDDTNDLFGMELGYNNSIGTGNATLYNGNISAMKWSSNLALGAVKDVAYNYSYDALNRITGASYATNTAGVWSNATGAFSESGYTYDLNGNIKSLKRFGATGNVLDSMYYAYSGNQLLKVKDSGDKTKGFIDGANTGYDYTYDRNGNMVSDQNKSLIAANAIQYNHLNLPIVVTKSTNEKIIYTYDAGGRKLKQDVYNTSGTIIKTTDYDGEFIYQGDTLQFINHEEGRIVMKGVSTPEYQYHLKDHLGNVRVTFTTAPVLDANTGTYEPANANIEQSKFLRYDNARRINATIFDHTNGANPGYSERLNGSANEKYGLARSVSVMPGDVISAEVYAKYVDPNSSNWTTALANLMSQISSNTAGVVVDGTSYSSSTSSFPAGYGTMVSKTDDGAPKAYLNWLVFDRNFAFVTGGFKQITTVCKEAGTDVPHEYLSSGNITITQPGYVYIYLSNESASTVEVYFDDFKVTQTSSLPVVQQEDYYPFGLSFNEYYRESSVPNKYLFNKGSERQDDLGLNIYQTHYRIYDMAIGRWWQEDPKADEPTQIELTPYNFGDDDPILRNDPDGDCPQCLIGAIVGAAVDYGTQVAVNLVQGKDLKTALTDVDATSIVTSAAIGAVTGGLSALKAASGAVKVADAAVDVANGSNKVVKAVNKVDDVAKAAWKGKIEGVAQKTGTPGHQFRSYREAITAAKDPNVQKVYLNKGVNKVTGSNPGTYKPNIRADVSVVNKNGKVNLIEVPSKSDDPTKLLKKVDDALGRLPANQQGQNNVARITTSKNP